MKLKESNMSELLKLFDGDNSHSSGVGSNAWKRWTVEEEEKLAELSFRYELDELASIMNRPVGSIEYRLRLLKRRGLDVRFGGDSTWTKERDEELIDLIPKMTYSDIAKRLGRTIFAIRKRISHLKEIGVNIPPRYNKFWPKGTDERLIELYKTKSANEVGEILGKAPSTITSRVRRLRDMGFTVEKVKGACWSKEEDEYLVKNYPTKCLEEMSLEINRTIQAIMARAKYLRDEGYKIERARWNAWQREEDDYLIKNYSNMTAVEISKKLNRTPSAVRSRISTLRERGVTLEK